MISGIRLQNFRSYGDSSFEFEPGANIIVGPNASGKTNLLEAVMVLALGSSYKTKDAGLLKHDKPWARLDGFFDHGDRVFKFEPTGDNLTKTMLINGKPHKRLGLNNTLAVVYFEPEHLQSITRGPSRRRDYFDEILERTQPGFKQVSSAYQRSLAQRNALLKSGRQTALPQIFAWDVRLGELGSKIAASRSALTLELDKNLARVYSQIAGKKTQAQLEYAPQFAIASYASKLISALENNFQKDLSRGFTGYGPHREDFIFKINGQLMGDTASRGEVRTMLLSLKTLELEMVEKAREQKPILLLDDVLSELDGARRQALIEILKDYQTILTTTDADAVLDYFANGAHKLIALD